MRKYLALALLLAGAANAQDAPAMRSAVPSDRAGNIATGSPELANQLPEPQVATRDVGNLLAAASAALAKGQTGAVQEALEQAETRALDRSVAYNDYTRPIDDPLIDEISQARQALGRGDAPGVARLIEAAQAQLRVPTKSTPR